MARIDDAGEKIGGARKDWRARAMTEADVGDMTAAEQATLVKKDHVWATPDYAAMVTDGMEPKAAALVKIVRDRLAAAPRTRKGAAPADAAAGYVAMVGMLRDLLLACRTTSDVEAVAGALFGVLDWKTKGRSDSALRTRMYSIYKGTACPFEIDADDRSRANVMLTEGFPAAVPPWRKGVQVRAMLDGSVFLCRGKEIIQDGFATPEAAWAWQEAKWKQGQTTVDAVPEPKRPHLANLGRVGPDRRNGADVTPERFLEEFGFRAVEFGNWLPDGERQEVLNLAFDACWDLAEVLGLPPKGLSLDGTLAVAFGARGQGGAAAHYEPGRRVLNMTRLNGAGSLAHEYGHALDHWLGATGGTSEVEGDGPRYASGRYHALPNRAAALPLLSGPLGAAIDKLMLLCRTAAKTKPEALAEAIGRVAEAEKALSRHASALVTYGERNPEGERDPSYYAEMAERRIGLEAKHKAEVERHAAISAAAEDANFGRRPSDFVVNAKALSGKSGDYWTRPTEMFARSFECAMFDLLAMAGRRSDYLVHGVEEGRFAGPGWKGDPYPAGRERRSLDWVFASMRDEVRLHLDQDKLAPLVAPVPGP